MHISPESGRYDNVHGDEDYRDHLGAEAIDYIDVLHAIEAGTSTPDGMHYYHWCTRIAESDEMTEIIKHIVKNRHKKEFAEIMNNIELAIEGWLP
jgi:hypothetical protein